MNGLTNELRQLDEENSDVVLILDVFREIECVYLKTLKQ